MAKKNIHISPLVMIVDELSALTQAQVRYLSERSHVPYGTIMKIRAGETLNPGIETIRAFLPYLPGQRKVEG